MATNNASGSSDPTIKKSGGGFGSLVDMADRIKPTTSGQVFQKPLPGGTSITVKKQPASGGQSCPMSGSVSGNQFVFSRPGTIGGLIPSNMFQGQSLLTLTLSPGWNYIFANVLTLTGLIQSVTIQIQGAPVEPIGETEGIPPTSFKIPLYAVFLDSGGGRAVRFFGCGNLGVQSVKRASYTKSSLSCGEYPFIDVYTWSVTLQA
jgi:hypothetical protein